MDYVYHEPQHEAGDRRCNLDNLLDDEHAPELTVWRAFTSDGTVEAFGFTEGDALTVIFGVLGEDTTIDVQTREVELGLVYRNGLPVAAGTSV